MIVERLTTPTAPAFDLNNLKKHCRIDGGDWDIELSGHGTAAATELQSYASLALIDQTIRVTLPAWPRTDTLGLPIIPMIDPLSVTVTADGVAFEAYAVTAGLRPALRLSGDRPCGVIVIEYLAGFGPTASSVPADLVNAIHDQASAFFDAKGAGDGKTNGMSPHMARIAARYRRVAV
jgi:uncharacterized phiE125 gp8 family phage protein